MSYLEDYYTLRGFDGLELKKHYARTTSFQFSYLNTIVESRNCLPSHGVRSSNLSSFKRHISKFLGLS